MIGLSLSLCVSDIIDGLVELPEVRLIITGTKACTPEDIEEVITQYGRDYWKRWDGSDRGMNIARQLLNQGKVFQPRCHNWDYSMSIAYGHWMTSNGWRISRPELRAVREGR